MALANLFGMFEGPELLIILAVVLLLFGGAKVPELARSLGRAKREFHDAISEPIASSGPSTERSDDTADDETVTVSRSELERLRAEAAQAHPQTPN